MITFPFGETAVLHQHNGSTRDGDGNDIPSFTDIPVDKGAFDPGGSTELVQGQDIVSAQPRWFPPAGVVVAPVDQVTIRGVRYEVDGQPADFLNPFTGWHPGMVVNLKAVSG